MAVRWGCIKKTFELGKPTNQECDFCPTQYITKGPFQILGLIKYTVSFPTIRPSCAPYLNYKIG